MRRRVTVCIAVLLPLAAGRNAWPAQRSEPLATSIPSQRAVLDKFCITCHSEKLHTAGLSLEEIDVGHPADNAAIWEKVLHKVRTREMPPPKILRPDESTYNALANSLETALDQAAEAKPNPGRPAVYRLNRFQYANAIRDLIDLE